MPRLFRQSPLNGIWEGSGNVQCRDVLRAVQRSPEIVQALMDEVQPAVAADRRLGDATDRLRTSLTRFEESAARSVVEHIALTVQAALLVRHGDAAVAEAFIGSRLAGRGGLAFGMLPAAADTDAILARALPALA